MFTVHTTGNSLGNAAVEAQTGLANVTLINKTLDLLNGPGAQSGAMGNASLASLGETTKNLVNAAMGKGLNLDTLA